MPASFPTAVKTFISRNAGDVIQPAHVNDLQDEVAAIEAGYLTGTAPIASSHVSAAAGLSVVGNSTMGSTITIGTVPYVFPSSGPVPGSALICFSTGATNRLEWGASPYVMTLIASNSGTDAAAGATDVSSVTISGLTAKDQLHITIANFASSQAVGSVSIRNQTDGVNLAVIGAMTANTATVGSVTLFQSQGTSTTVWSVVNAYEGANDRGNSTFAGVATAWTGSWSLALRHGGVTAGGTMQYRWNVYKIAGQ
jgi:hypothetical protein